MRGGRGFRGGYFRLGDGNWFRSGFRGDRRGRCGFSAGYGLGARCFGCHSFRRRCFRFGNGSRFGSRGFGRVCRGRFWFGAGNRLDGGRFGRWSRIICGDLGNGHSLCRGRFQLSDGNRFKDRGLGRVRCCRFWFSDGNRLDGLRGDLGNGHGLCRGRF